MAPQDQMTHSYDADIIPKPAKFYPATAWIRYLWRGFPSDGKYMPVAWDPNWAYLDQQWRMYR